jgi:hypothetical protein
MTTQFDVPAALPAVQGEGETTAFLAAFQKLEQEIRALPEKDLVAVNLDVSAAVATVLGAVPEILTLRAEMAKLDGVDVKKIDKLRDFALALGHAHGAYRAALGPSDPVAKLGEDALGLRDQLYTDAAGLAKRGLLDVGRVSKLKSGLGYKNLAFDVVGLVQLFRERAKELAGKTPVTEQELKQAEELAEKLVEAVGLREQSPTGLTAATLLRQQAFTLFSSAYDEARRAISFLRWNHGDVDQIAPSLFAGRGGRKPVDVAPSEPAVPSPPAPAGTTAPVATAPTAAVGLPGATPFAH